MGEWRFVSWTKADDEEANPALGDAEVGGIQQLHRSLIADGQQSRPEMS